MSANTEIHPSITAFSWIAKKAMNALLYCLPKQLAAEALCGPVDYGVLHTIHHCSLTTHYSPLTGCFSVQAALACRPHNFLLTTHYSQSLVFGPWSLAYWLLIDYSPLTTHHSLLTQFFQRSDRFSVPTARPHSPFTIHHCPLTGLLQRSDRFSVQTARPYSPFTIHHSQFTIAHSPLTIHHCPLTTHYSLLTGFFQRYKAFQLKNRLPVIAPCGKALCLLKTQFAKKPKNPV